MHPRNFSALEDLFYFPGFVFSVVAGKIVSFHTFCENCDTFRQFDRIFSPCEKLIVKEESTSKTHC